MFNQLEKANRALLLCAALGLTAAPVLGQPETDEQMRPVPRHEDGRVNFGPPPGESGTWSRRTSTLAVNPDYYRPQSTLDSPIHIDDVPIQAWALALTNYRNDIFLASEPYTRCKPSGGPRQFMSPYGLEIVDIPDLERVFIFNISNAMSYRTVFMDGRDHPENLRPSYMGHSVGHWEGDTLVIDTVGMNERTWMNRDGLPHTDQLHLVERLNRVSFDTLEYEVTIDDPGAYTAPWTSGYTLGWGEGEEMFEYICQENNLSPESMLGEGGKSRIIP
ncbi:MAG: hypothetical protein WD601_01840 [Pseudohongiellaceae bacterium]